jgi:cyclopropane fatty-acyl-phospholipid synthase-like methyltransferase
MKRLYEPIYHLVRIFKLPISWVFGSHPELSELVESGRITPGRAIDLGCGVGNEAIYLAKNGFEVTGIDSSPTAIQLARDKAQEAGVEVVFIVDDLTELRYVDGTFDLLVDYGALNDLTQKDRDSYMSNVLPLSNPDSCYLLMCFEKKLPSDEIVARFGESFNIETIGRKSEDILPRNIVFYLMTKK